MADSHVFVILLWAFLHGVASTRCPSACLCETATWRVSCQGAGLTSLPANLPSSTTSLDMTRNTLRTIGGHNKILPSNLVELKLRENRIEVIDNEIGIVTGPSLQTLDLSSNNLSHIAGGVLRRISSALLHVDLSRNRLVDVDGAFVGLVELSRLDIRENLLTLISASTFDGLANLRYLRLDDNHIRYVDAKAFADLDK